MLEAKKVLQEFGLTENEAQVYLILLRLGSATASEIVEKTSIHRINLYDILERLQEKGLVSFVILGKRKAYEAVEPKNILELEDERRKSILEILPQLEGERKLSKQKQEATIFKDKRGIKNIVDELTKVKEFDFFASGWGFAKAFGQEYSDIWHEKLKVNKVKVRCLLSKKFKETLKVPESLNYRWLPSEFVFPSTTLLFQDKIFIIMWGSEPIGILIRGKEVYDSYKQFFELLWKLAKK